MPTRATRAVLAYGPFIVIVIVAGLVASPAANDFFQFWWAGHLVATGASPYDPEVWKAALAYGRDAGAVAGNCVVPEAAACLWTYPPWTAWIFAPSSALGPALGIAIQRIALVTALATGGVLWLRAARATDGNRSAMLIGFAASAPFVRDVVTGHFEGVLLVALFLIGAALRDRRVAGLVIGALLLSLKPHLFLALAPLVATWLVWQRAYRALAVTALALVALAAAAFASDPAAWPALVGRSLAKQRVPNSSVWDFAAAVAGGAAPAVAIIGLGVALAAAVVAWRRSKSPDRPTVLVAGGSALSLAIAPYLQSYDLVLLFPTIAIVMAALTRRHAVISAAAIVIVTWTAYLLELSGDARAFAGILPALSLVALAISQRRSPERHATESATAMEVHRRRWTRAG